MSEPEQITFEEWLVFKDKIERMMGDSDGTFRGTVVSYEPLREIETVETGDYL